MMLEITLGGVLYTLFIVFAFGACIGSFLNVCIYRIPRDESVVTPRSHCPKCDKLIAWYDNIPVVSWIALRAKCRYCKTAISPRYILVETLIGILFVLVWLLYGIYADGNGSYWLLPDPRVPVYWLIISGLAVATFVDFEHFIIPDRISLGGIPAGIILSIAVPSMQGTFSRWDAFYASLVGAVCGAGILWAVGALGKLAFKKDAMGMGDVKLLGAIGAFMGWKCVLFTIIASSFFGSFVGIGLIIGGNKKWQSRIPYGPYIAMGAVLWLLWGHDWWQAYMTWVMTP